MSQHRYHHVWLFFEIINEPQEQRDKEIKAKVNTINNLIGIDLSSIAVQLSEVIHARARTLVNVNLRALPVYLSFVHTLCKQAGSARSTSMRQAVFAMVPGWPLQRWR